VIGHKLTIQTDATQEGTTIVLDGVEIAKRVNEIEFSFGLRTGVMLRFVAVAPIGHEAHVPLPDLAKEVGSVRRIPSGGLEVQFGPA
jgi:hypothetical protein